MRQELQVRMMNGRAAGDKHDWTGDTVFRMYGTDGTVRMKGGTELR